MIRITKLILVFFAFVVPLAVSHGFAEEWVANKLRGGVFVFDDGDWQQIFRGHVVDSSAAIQTAPNARVVFMRGKESIDVRGDTRIRIKDRVGALSTVVEQDFGEITVDVEKQNVQHFAVRAPLLTAVVKGTKFTVKADKNGNAAEVQVRRGRVEVQDNERKVKVDVKAGQRAGRQGGANAIVEVSGRGSIEPFFGMASNKPIANDVAELKAKLGLGNAALNASKQPSQSKAKNENANNPNVGGNSNAGGSGSSNGNDKGDAGSNVKDDAGSNNKGNAGSNNKGNAGDNGKGKER
ncbi:FecR family protein [Maritalea myrionectae]|uniref:FecR family protein n=1 Tax=Maritalea myrionectae TaxID=454601 RepID=UPI0004282D84|nr:FecR family protein [Maritalea myrionectae]